jgi:hypothetical protein
MKSELPLLLEKRILFFKGKLYKIRLLNIESSIISTDLLAKLLHK